MRLSAEALRSAYPVRAVSRLEDLSTGALVRGVLADRVVRVVHVEWRGSDALTPTCTDDEGRPGPELLYRTDEARLAVEEPEGAWSLDTNGHLFRLVSEEKRISLAYLFDAFLAVRTSTLEPLLHQIDAVYSKMLPRLPLRFLLADDSGDELSLQALSHCPASVLAPDPAGTSLAFGGRTHGDWNLLAEGSGW